VRRAEQTDKWEAFTGAGILPDRRARRQVEVKLNPDGAIAQGFSPATLPLTI
jgi:hypothetical protein